MVWLSDGRRGRRKRGLSRRGRGSVDDDDSEIVVRANTNMSRMCLREESWKPVVNCEVPGLKVFGMCVCFHLVYVIIKRNLWQKTFRSATETSCFN